MIRLFKYDISIQIRSGYWTVYGIIGLIYILVLINLPIDIRDEIAIYLIFSDTSVLGLIFVGALILFEKNQGVLQSISVTPLKFDRYLFSKAISLTILSAVVSSLIWLIPLKSFAGYPLLLAGTVLASLGFTIFGIGFSSGAYSFNQFIVRVVMGSMVFIIPVIVMLLFPTAKWLIVLPMNALLDLYIQITRGFVSFLQFVDLLVLGIWIFILREFAKRQFLKHNLFN